MERIRSHRELDVYQMAFEAAMRIFEVSKSFPVEERYSLTDPRKLSGLRFERSDSHEVKNEQKCTIVFLQSDKEAFRKRKYPKAFISKLSDAEGEAAETQTWYRYQ